MHQNTLARYIIKRMQDLKCRLCSDSTGHKIETKDQRVFYLCAACEFISLDPKFFLTKEEEKARYDLHENTIEDLGYVKMFTDFIDFAIEPHKENIEKALDFGSGPGPVLASLLEDNGFNTDIYDPYFAADTQLKESSYDLITATEVFEHFNKPRESIAKLVSLLKPKAYLAVMTCFPPAKQDFDAWWYKNDPSHVSFYSLKSFEYLAREFSLKITRDNGKNIIVFQKK